MNYYRYRVTTKLINGGECIKSFWVIDISEMGKYIQAKINVYKTDIVSIQVRRIKERNLMD